MKRILILATISILTILLLLGLYAPASYPMLFAATTDDYAIVRAGLILILVSLLIYEPPREPHFRVALAVIATLLMFAAGSVFVNYDMKLFDAMLLLEAAILLYIEAAELSVPRRAAKQEGSLSSQVSRKARLQTT